MRLTKESHYKLSKASTVIAEGQDILVAEYAVEGLLTIISRQIRTAQAEGLDEPSVSLRVLAALISEGCIPASRLAALTPANSNL